MAEIISFQDKKNELHKELNSKIDEIEELFDYEEQFFNAIDEKQKAGEEVTMVEAMTEVRTLLKINEKTKEIVDLGNKLGFNLPEHTDVFDNISDSFN